MRRRRFMDRLRASFKAFVGIEQISGATGYLPAARYDYEAAAGNLWESSIVMACVNWASNALPEAPLVVRRVLRGVAEELPDHPLVKLCEQPNPYYGQFTLMAGTILSLMVDGNAYWLKRRTEAGKVAELWYLPHFAVTPKGDAQQLVTEYEFKQRGGAMSIAPQDMVHFRKGVDPHDLRKGLSPLRCVLREVATDNEASTYAACILRNMGVPGVMIAPKLSDGAPPMREDDASRIKQLFRERFTNERRGEPLVLSEAMEVTPVGWSPKDISVDVLRRVPEERISAALGIPAIVVGLGAGLERSTFANYAEAREAAYESGIIPLQKLIATHLTQQLLRPEAQFNSQPTDQVAFDTSEVRILQEDMNRLAERMNLGVQGGWIKVSEARASQGLPSDPSDEIYLRSMNLIPTTSAGQWTPPDEP